jgi:hypothetical protein
MSDIHIDAPGAGDWVVEHWKGCFREGFDHSFTTHDGDRVLGGFVLSTYMGDSMTIHMAAEDPHWCSRDLLWMVFHYAFEQAGCRKLFAPVRSDNYHALSENFRAGWHLEAVLRDAYTDGVHLMILEMTKDECPWLDYKPRAWREAA